MIQAFRRRASPFETAHFRLRGLKPGSTYAVKDLDSGSESRHMAKDLMETGLDVSISKQPGAAILAYRKVE